MNLEKNQILVFEDVFLEEDLKEFDQLVSTEHPGGLFWNERGTAQKYDKYVHGIVNLVSPYQTFEGASGYEVWYRNNMSIGPHDDGYSVAGERFYPYCSMMMYTDISMEYGGELLLRDLNIRITPKTNMLVIFDPHLTHAAAVYEGENRKGIAINFWDKKPILGSKYR